MLSLYLARNSPIEKIIDDTRQKLLDQGIVHGELLENIATAFSYNSTSQFR